MPRLSRLQWALLVLLLIPCWIIGWRFVVDLKTIHRTAVVAHVDLHGVYDLNPGVGRFYYFPTSVVLLAPLGYLSLDALKVVWLLLQTLSYAMIFYGLAKLYPVVGRTRTLPFLAIWIFAINPIHNNFQSNNIGLMLMAVMIGAERLLESDSARRRFWGGALSVLPAAIKVFPAFITAYYFLTRGREARRGILVGAVLCLVAPFVAFGAGARDLYHDFFRNLFFYKTENSLTEVPDILCLPSMLARWGFPFTRELMIAMAVGFFAWARRARATTSRLHVWSFALLLMTLINPSTRVHYFIFYVPAICSTLQLAVDHAAVKIPAWTGACLALLLVAFTTEGIVGKAVNDRLEMWSVPTFGLMILGVTLLYALLRVRESARS